MNFTVPCTVLCCTVPCTVLCPVLYCTVYYTIPCTGPPPALDPHFQCWDIYQIGMDRCPQHRQSKINLDYCPARAGLPLSVQIDLDFYPGGQSSRSNRTSVQVKDSCPDVSGQLSTRIEIQIYLDGQWQSGSSWTIVQIYF